MDNAALNQQQILDAEHLRLLALFYYVKGAITALFACIPIIHIILGLVMLLAPHVFGHGKDQPPAFLGWLFLGLGTFLILFGWTFAALTLFAGRCIARRTHPTYCLVMGCIECLSVPFGTVLGVCTIMVLNRPSVRERFETASRA